MSGNLFLSYAALFPSERFSFKKMNRTKYDQDFYDDASSVYDFGYDQHISGYYQESQATTSMYEQDYNKKRQTDATLGGLLGTYEEDTEIYNESDSTPPSYSTAVEKQVANLTYIESPKPLYDPNCKEVSNKALHKNGMMIPQILDYNLQRTKETRNVNESKDVKRENRIKELKMEIDQLDHKVALDEKNKRSKKSRCCYCCPTTRHGKLTLFITLTLLLGALALVLYFFWPKVPEFKVKNLQTFSGVRHQFIESVDSFRLIYPLNLTVEVINRNRYGIQTDQIFMKLYISPNISEIQKTNYPGSLLTGKVNDHLVGEANTTRTKFPAQTTKIFFFNLTIDFFPDPDLGLLGDPAIGEILRVCNDEARANKTLMTIVYEVEIKIGLFSKFGFTPRILDQVGIGCPLGNSTADSILERFGLKNKKI